MTYTLDTLLRELMHQGGSDLHLAAGSPPIMRLDGVLAPFHGLKPVDGPTIQKLVYAILSEGQIRRLEQRRNLDLSYQIDEGRRYRGNVLWHRGALGAVFRAIPPQPPSIEELGLPEILKDLAARPRGLVLVTGPSGSGKSTTLAAAVEHINRTSRRHVITVEDPIEYVHENRLSIVRQREVGTDVESFSDALKYVLRQDPDVIVVGEMRDLETMTLAMSAAETGHLVLATLHTISAQATVERVIDVFPPGQQLQMRVQLASTLEGVICQALLPHSSGRGRVCATEIMVSVPAVRTLIRDGQHHRIMNVVETGARYGMSTLNQSLREHVVRGDLLMDDALACSPDPEGLKKMVELTRRTQ